MVASRCDCDPLTRPTDGTPQRAGVRVSTEGIRCLYCHKIVSLATAETKKSEPLSMPLPSFLRGNLSGLTAASVRFRLPEITDLTPANRQLWQLFCDLTAQSNQGELDTEEVWTQFLRFIEIARYEGQLDFPAALEFC